MGLQYILLDIVNCDERYNSMAPAISTTKDCCTQSVHNISKIFLNKFIKNNLLNDYIFRENVKFIVITIWRNLLYIPKSSVVKV